MMRIPWISLITTLALVLAGLGLMLVGCQRRMIYFPSSYPSGLRLPPRVEALAYRTDQGAQAAFWVPPPSGRPARIWVCFGGNAALALDWWGFVSACPDPDAGFLLVDYPGYGHCEGAPTPGRILASSEAALDTLLARLPEKDRPPEIRTLGHSLGAACALQFAARRQAARIVLVSPFTSAVDMGRRIVGWPLCHLVWHRFDNRARLAEIAGRRPRPAITIFHGDRDEVIPVAMGRELAQVHRDFVDYREIPGGDHNGILDGHRAEIHQAMTRR